MRPQSSCARHSHRRGTPAFTLKMTLAIAIREPIATRYQGQTCEFLFPFMRKSARWFEIASRRSEGPERQLHSYRTPSPPSPRLLLRAGQSAGTQGLRSTPEARVIAAASPPKSGVPGKSKAQALPGRPGPEDPSGSSRRRGEGTFPARIRDAIPRTAAGCSFPSAVCSDPGRPGRPTAPERHASATSWCSSRTSGAAR